MDKDDSAAFAGDSRFAAFGYDPRFRRPKAKETSVKLEKRFARVMTDKRFNDLGVSSHAKSGFAIEGDKDTAEEVSKDSKDAGSASEFDGLESRLELLNMMARGEIAVDGSSSDESDDDADWTGTGKADAMAKALDAQVLAAEASNAAPDIGEGQSAPQTEEITARLALVSLDWDHTRAEDIYTLLRSFVPATGRLERVSVFPSDYGEKMIAQETALGPKGIWTEEKGVDQGNQARKARLKRLDSEREQRRLERLAAQQREEDDDDEDDDDEDDDDEDDEEESDSDDSDDSDAEESRKPERAHGDDDGDKSGDGDGDDDDESDGNDGGFDPEKLRLYELGRLRYYFAEAVFDSPDTAAKVYQECDGREFGSTGTVVDLRFIPDDTTFEHKVARDVAADVDTERYEAPEFSTSALRSTNVELSWDAPDPRRERKLRQWISEMRDAEAEGKRQRRRKKKLAGMLSQGKAGGMTAEDVALKQEEDLRQFLAPASDEEEDDEEHLLSDDEDEDDDEDDQEEEEHAAKRSMRDAGHSNPSKAERKHQRKQRKAEARRKARLLLAAVYDSDDEGDDQARSQQLGNDEDSDGVRESTFTPGLGKALEERRQLRGLEQGETPWEAYQRKRKEKKAEKKRLRKEKRSSDHAVGRSATSGQGASGQGSSDLYDDFGPPPGEAGAEASDPFFSMDNLQLEKPLETADFSSSGAAVSSAGAAAGLRVAGAEELERRRKQQRAERAEKAARAAEEAERQRREKANLELLMMADPGTAEAVAESDTRGFDVRALAQAHKDATGKGGSQSRKRRREAAKKAVEKDTFQVDAADARFSRVGLDPDMAIDPTNPAFKDTPAMRGFMAENRNRRQRAGSDLAKSKAGKAAANDTKEAAGGSTISGGAALAALVATVKRKAEGAARGIVKGTDHAKMNRVKAATAAAARRARSSSRKNASKRS